MLLNGVRDPMLSWFEDYLTGHFQSVALDGVTSTSIAVTSGVPQGSILVNVSLRLHLPHLQPAPLYLH